jgi:hypothetical protein
VKSVTIRADRPCWCQTSRAASKSFWGIGSKSPNLSQLRLGSLSSK